MTKKENSAKRRPPFRESPDLILIVSAKKTEPAYFSGLNKHLANSSTRVKMVGRDEDPAKLVKFAAGVGGDFDHIWCVVDIDQFDITAAQRSAARAGVELAISNPCFEYWLLLHFENCTKPMTEYRHVLPSLRKYLSTYDKTELRFDNFVDGIEDALERARKRCPEHGKENRINPSTGIWALVDLMRGT